MRVMSQGWAEMKSRTQPKNQYPWDMLTPKERKQLEALAVKDLRVETLEVRNRDSLDFYDIGVACLRDALAQAYIMGWSKQPK